MLDRVMRAPMQFFIRTRTGSIVQRFSGDLVSLDLETHKLAAADQQDMVVECAELVGETTMAVSQGEELITGDYIFLCDV